jgi:hypothetical protein
MATAKQFNSRMRRLAKNTATNLTAKVNKIALQVLLNILQSTPVDTGMAISNWILSLSDPSDEQIPPYSPGSKGSTRQRNIGAAYNTAQAGIQDRTPKQIIYITNSLPYIGLLNDGSSSQAPSGFVQSAVLNAVRSTSGIKVIT